MSASSPMAQDYLKLIFSTEEWGGDGLSISELAARASVVPSTASENVRKLAQMGLVSHEPYQQVHLTDAGRAEAITMVRRHRLLETYLYERLDFDWDEVHEEADNLEHVVSDRLLEHIDRALGYPMRDPHGDPIPSADGAFFTPKMIPLDDLSPHTPARVVRISDLDSALLRHLDGQGVVLDTAIEVLARHPYAGMTTLRITPPAQWNPRRPDALAKGVAPGVPLDLDLATPATAAIWVSVDSEF